MKFSYFVLVFLFLPLSIFALGEGSRIDMGVSPIKHEFSVGTGKTITKTITFFNNSDTTYNIYLTAEDCVADDKVGTPKCRAITSTGSDPASLASWVRFEGATRFSVPAKSERKINFSVNPPSTALPGGHYGAIFLNNPENNTSDGNNIKMVRRAGVLLLVSVPGKIIYSTEIGDIEIEVPTLSSAPDEVAPFSLDPTRLETWESWMKRLLRELDPRLDAPILVDISDFSVNFTIPISNSGNIHSLPVGRIELYDEKGSLLQKIGKESIRTPEGVFLGEKIVDYLPINDEGGNVLPGSNRIYSVIWKGFAYETIEAGKSVIKFLSPGAYYSNLTQDNARYLLPWEKLRIYIATKRVHAKIYVEYSGLEGKLVPYDLERDIYVKYNYIDKGLNWGVILIILLVVYIAWRIIRKKDHEIEELEDEVDDLEDEVDEFDKAKKMAKKVIAAKKSAPLKPVVTPMIEESRVKKTPLKKTVAKNPTLTKTPLITPKKKSAPNTPNK